VYSICICSYYKLIKFLFFLKSESDPLQTASPMLPDNYVAMDDEDLSLTKSDVEEPSPEAYCELEKIIQLRVFYFQDTDMLHWGLVKCTVRITRPPKHDSLYGLISYGLASIMLVRNSYN
jgi:hypothetical protein